MSIKSVETAAETALGLRNLNTGAGTINTIGKDAKGFTGNSRSGNNFFMRAKNSGAERIMGLNKENLLGH